MNLILILHQLRKIIKHIHERVRIPLLINQKVIIPLRALIHSLQIPILEHKKHIPNPPYIPNQFQLAPLTNKPLPLKLSQRIPLRLEYPLNNAE